jgi:predicted ATPase/class 3 adenylate cyclase
MQASPGVVTYLFTDIEGSARLWEQEAGRMRSALARHDAIVKDVLERHRGVTVKSTGDGVHAVFDDPHDALRATLDLQLALADPTATGGLSLYVRCGLHAGVDERRDDDFFGQAVNRAARIMSVSHGGQILLSEAVAALIRDRLPGGVSLRDLGAVRLRDLARAERIYQVIHPGLRADFPALRTLETTPNNLPQELTSFVGREREMAEIAKALRDTRLLTLFGVGGIGKTRLSLQLAARLLDQFPDGAWFVELAPLRDPELVPQATASVLGVKEEPGLTVLDALRKHARDRRMLLILDNCEHLVRACAELARQLLESCPHVKIIASSREHLHLGGEATYAVPALAVPQRPDTATPESLGEYESARLFLDRAVAAQPAFRITAQNAASLAEICRRLDGIPLAIELAAARVRALSVENIAVRLDDRFRLLTGGDRTALPRQQTLRALIGWSYDLLPPEERALFRRLSVFAGGWTLEAAEAVGANGEARAEDVLDLLTRLVEKSLIVVEAAGERYRLLETVREYAQERLREFAEQDHARARHLAFYSGFAERARAELNGPQQAAWLARLDLEQENLLAAHAWCDRAPGGADLGLRLVAAMKLYWINRGLLGLGLRVTMEALARPDAQSRGQPRCRALFNAGQIGCWMGRYSEARIHLEEGLAIARETGDSGSVAQILQPLGMASLGQGDLGASRRYLQEALDLAQQLGNKRELAAALNAMAQLHRVEGDNRTAEALYERVTALARELGDRESIAVGLLNLAMVSIGRGPADRAPHLLREVLDIVAETGSKPAAQSALEVSAGLAASCKEWLRAARLFGVAEAQTAETGLHRDPTDEAFLSPLVASARKALGSGPFADAEAEGRGLSPEAALAELRGWLEARR